MITPHKLYRAITQEILHSEFLKLVKLDKNFIYKYIESSHFFNQVTKIVYENDYSSQAAYDLCQPLLEEMWKEDKPEKPLYYFYQYALSYSFPSSIEIELNEEWNKASLLYLKVLRVIGDYEKKSTSKSMVANYPLNLLSDEEESAYRVSEEYSFFKKTFYQEYVYEMMKLNQDLIKFNTLDHICGVHYLALFIGKQLFKAGFPVDLGRVSGAGAGHDIGKFGCRSWEGSRVAYLHYYYTDLWFKKRNINYIGNIALNHSTWDLELENLSIESLLLIYSDFRVKNDTDDKGKTEMKFFTLKDSFDVILNKLDNLDSKKVKRYVRVYNKLKDFEDYICQLGIELDPNKAPQSIEKTKKYYSLMKGIEITQELKYLAINHNIHLMYQFRDETSLSEVLEIIRSENNPTNLREYLDVLKEYSTYLTQKQKIITIRFLYEKLIHPEEDIRKQCAELIGSLIALFDEKYRKEIPEGVSLPPADINSFDLLEEFLNLFVEPDHKIIPLHRQWIGYNTKILITTVLNLCEPGQVNKFKEVILKYYNKSNTYETYINICLLDVVGHIPLEDDEGGLAIIYNYIKYNYKNSDPTIRVAALSAITYLMPLLKKYPEFINDLNTLLASEVKDSIAAENYLKIKIIESLKWDRVKIQKYYNSYKENLEDTSNIFLSNLKTATNWVTKKVQVRIVLENFLDGKNNDGLYTAMHYCNLLKVSGVESVRNSAGKALVSLMPSLPLEQRNDISVELLRALELESYQFTKYIPNYLGQVLLFLKPYELDEVIDDIKFKIKQSNNQIKSLLFRTVGVIINNYPNYKDVFSEDKNVYIKRKNKLLGILLNGLAHDSLNIRQISFSVLGKEVFGSNVLSLEEKYNIFKSIAKKILTLLGDNEEDQLLFLTNSSGLNNIYRFISDYIFNFGSIYIKTPKQVAFFPGSFDPFTLGHKEICRAIKNERFEVYLAVDEFSWSKRTQPHLIRRNIVNMSIADEMDVYLYPEDFPVNIANPDDLKALKDNLASDKVFMVVGSDVILNASAYKGKGIENSITEFPHIIFERRNSNSKDNELNLNKVLDLINNELIKLNIPPQYEDVSSTQFRSYIDRNMDTSDLIDPLAQKYIHETNLYRHEPRYKSVIQSISVDVNIIDNPTGNLLNNIVKTLHDGSKDAYENIKRVLAKQEGKIILINHIEDNKIIAYGAIHWIPSDEIYNEFKNVEITKVIRENYTGRIVSIDGLFVNYNQDNYRMQQIILTEILAYSLKNDYGYAIYNNTIDNGPIENIVDILKLQGFIDIPYSKYKQVLAVNMTNPCTLNLDLETVIKEPFKSRRPVKEVIKKTRRNLQEALTDLYPGNLVISFDKDMINETLIKKICMENGVSPIPTNPRKLGSLMCVPFGNILNRAIVPNTVTKSLHVEKLFNPDMKRFTIGPYPYYLNLDNQIKMIRSFNKPIILIDDLLHKGYRIKGIGPILKEQSIDVHKTIVGILSGRGKELMDIKNREVDCAYFIPKLRLWFNENSLYPFIGGDTLWRGVSPSKNLISSINLILPYTSPHFIKGVTNRSVFRLSEVCILNTMEILQVLEEEYQKMNERKLTLGLLGDVFISPRYPDAGENILYDLSVNPSNYLENNLETLRKLEHSIITGDLQRIDSDEILKK